MKNRAVLKIFIKFLVIVVSVILLVGGLYIFWQNKLVRDYSREYRTLANSAESLWKSDYCNEIFYSDPGEYYLLDLYQEDQNNEFEDFNKATSQLYKSITECYAKDLDIIEDFVVIIDSYLPTINCKFVKDYPKCKYLKDNSYELHDFNKSLGFAIIEFIDKQEDSLNCIENVIQSQSDPSADFSKSESEQIETCWKISYESIRFIESLSENKVSEYSNINNNIRQYTKFFAK